MHPVLVQFNGITLYSYGALVAAAVLASLVIAEARAQRYGLEKSQAADLIFALFIFGVVGARLFYAAQHWDAFAGDPWSLFNIREGGLVWYGGLLTAIAGGAVYARLRGWRVLGLADFFAPIAALAHGIGRIGCFLNGCCYGLDGGRIPAQLIEAAGLFALSAALFRYASAKPASGRVLWVYLMGYGLLRFLVEFLRGDNARYLHLSLPQWMSLALAAAALFFFRRARR